MDGEDIETACPKCGKIFRCYEEEQVPGFRQMSELYCPCCGYMIDKSMEIEYFISRDEE